MADKRKHLTALEIQARAEREAAAQRAKAEPNNDAVQPDYTLIKPNIAPVSQMDMTDPVQAKKFQDSLNAFQAEASKLTQPDVVAKTPTPAPAPVAELTPIPESETEKDKDPVKKPEIEHCPNCGFKVHLEPIQVTEEDRRNFLRSIFAKTRFEKEYKLFENTEMCMRVVFRDRKTGEEEQIAKQLRQEIADRRLLMVDPATAMSNYIYRQSRLRMAASIVKIDGGMMLFTLPAISTEEAEAQFKPEKNDNGDIVNYPVAVMDSSVYQDWPGPLYGAVFREFTRFEELVRRLTEGANQPDFWKGTAGQA